MTTNDLPDDIRNWIDEHYLSERRRAAQLVDAALRHTPADQATAEDLLIEITERVEQVFGLDDDADAA